MVSSPIVYIETSGLAKAMRDLTPVYFAPVPALYHYLHIANNHLTELDTTNDVKIKKYFYILRPVLACMWIEKNNTMPPMRFDILRNDQPIEKTVSTEIDILLQKKMAGKETDRELKNSLIVDFLKEKADYYHTYLKSNKKGKEPDYGALNQLFQSTLHQVWNG